MVFEITQSASPVGTNLKEGEVKKALNVADQAISKPRNFVMEIKERKVVKKLVYKLGKVRSNTTFNIQKAITIFQRQTTFTPLQRIKFNKYVENIIVQILHKFSCV